MQGNNSKVKNEKKGVTPVLAGFSVLFICVFLITLVGMLAYFNVGGLGLDVIKFFRQNEAIASEEQKALEAERTELMKFRLQLEAKEKELDEREVNLKKELENAKTKEALMESEKKKYEQMRLQITPEFESIQSLVKLYSAMDAKKVADIFENLDDIDLKVKIIKTMDVSYASAVLSNMSPDKAAALLKRVADSYGG